MREVDRLSRDRRRAADPQPRRRARAAGERVDLGEAARRAAARWRAAAGEREIELEIAPAADGRLRLRRRRTSTARSTRWSRTRCAYSPAGVDGRDRRAARARSRCSTRARARSRARRRRSSSASAAAAPGARGPAGTGLGLPIARELARAVGRRRDAREPRRGRPGPGRWRCTHEHAGDDEMGASGAGRAGNRDRGRGRRRQPRQPPDRPFVRAAPGRRCSRPTSDQPTRDRKIGKSRRQRTGAGLGSRSRPIRKGRVSRPHLRNRSRLRTEPPAASEPTEPTSDRHDGEGGDD